MFVIADKGGSFLCVVNKKTQKLKLNVFLVTANDPIMSGRSIKVFRHLEHQNQSIISDSIGRARIVQHFGNRRRKGGLELT